MKKWLTVAIIVFILLFPSCSPSVSMDPVSPDNTVAEIVESFALFPETEVAGEYAFVTNKSEYIKPYGMTFWASKLVNQIPFTQLDVSLYKVSGNYLAGYGLIFCHGLRGDPLIETMLVIMINQNQEFIIGKVIEDRFTAVVPWTYSNFLVNGYSQENRVKISFDRNSEEFFLYINNSLQIVFTDNEEPLHQSGSSGFLTVISPLDNFPQIPVEIIFQVH